MAMAVLAPAVSWPPRVSRAAAPWILAGFALAAAGIWDLLSNPSLFVVTTLDGLTSAGLFFLVASGFTLIFGLLRVTNLAHGSFYLAGGYIGYSVQQATGNWVVALLGAALAVALIGMLFELVVLRRVQGDPMRESLVTIGLSVVIADVTLAVWGGSFLDIGVPHVLESTIHFDGMVYPKYRLALLGLAILVGAGLWVLLKKTRLGMTIRAGVDDPSILATTGVNVPVVLSLVFGLGSLLAGLAGVAGGSYLSVSQGEDGRYLLVSLLVVIVGGLGSVPGAALGALVVGLVEAYAQVHVPTYSTLVTFGVMIAILAVRPRGLLGGAA